MMMKKLFPLFSTVLLVILFSVPVGASEAASVSANEELNPNPVVDAESVVAADSTGADESVDADDSVVDTDIGEKTASGSDAGLAVESIEASGYAGPGLTWDLTSDGTLTISGDGEMYNASRAYGTTTGGPWFTYNYMVRRAFIEEGVTNIGLDAFYNCTNLKEVHIAESVESIMDGAFWGCKSLQSITIPSTVSHIHFDAFKECSSLSEINVAGDNPYYRNLNGFVVTTDELAIAAVPVAMINSTYLVIPQGVTAICSDAFVENKIIQTVYFPPSLKSIGDRSFAECSSLRYLELPKNLEFIGYEAFAGCTALKSADLPASITNMSSRVFVRCSSLEAVSFEEGFTEIYSDMFSGVKSIKTLFIPSSVWKIGNYAFSECEGIRTIFFGGSAYDWNNIIFGNNNIPYLMEGYANDLKTYYDVSRTSISGADWMFSPDWYSYDGRAKVPAVKVYWNGTELKKGTDYTVAYTDNVGPGYASVVVFGAGQYNGYLIGIFEIVGSPASEKEANPLAVKAKTVTVKASKVKTKAVTVKASKAFSVTEAAGSVSYQKVSGSGALSVSSSGTIKVKKKTKKGTYKIKVKVKASGDTGHKAGSKTVTVTVKVK